MILGDRHLHLLAEAQHVAKFLGHNGNLPVETDHCMPRVSARKSCGRCRFLQGSDTSMGSLTAGRSEERRGQEERGETRGHKGKRRSGI